MTNLIIIKVSKHINRFIRKCIDYKINLFEVSYIDKDNILVKIKLEDYTKVKRLNYYSNIKIVKYEGTKGIKRHFKKYIYIYLIVIFCFILMDISTNFIVKVDIIHENSKIRKLVKENLIENGIGKISLAKDFDQLNIIKNNMKTSIKLLITAIIFSFSSVACTQTRYATDQFDITEFSSIKSSIAF